MRESADELLDRYTLIFTGVRLIPGLFYLILKRESISAARALFTTGTSAACVPVRFGHMPGNHKDAHAEYCLPASIKKLTPSKISHAALFSASGIER